MITIPTPPSRATQDRVTFNMVTDAFLAAWPQWTADVNALGASMEGAVTEMAGQVSAAAASADAALVQASAAADSLAAAQEIETELIVIATAYNRRKTYAELEAVLDDYEEGEWGLVAIDETNDNHSSVYEKQSGAWERIIDLSEGAPPSFDDILGDPDDNAALVAFVLDGLADKQDASAALTSWAGKTVPSGTPVGTTDAQSLSGKTLTMPQMDGIAIEDCYSITDAAGFVVDPANGGVQRVTLGASRTPVLTSITAGKWVLLLVDDGAAYTLTLTSGSPTLMNYSGTFPGLKTSGYTPLLFLHDGVSLKYWVCGSAP